MRQFDFAADNDELETEPGTLTYAQTEALARSEGLGNTETAPHSRGPGSAGRRHRGWCFSGGVTGARLTSTPRRASES